MGCNKNRYQKSVARTYNNASQEITATPSALTLVGNVSVNTGCSIEIGTGSYRLNYSGLYHISADVTLTATAAGTALVQLAVNGTVLPCAVSSATMAAAGVYTLHVETDICAGVCAVNKPVITVLAGGVAGTVTHVCAGVTKIA